MTEEADMDENLNDETPARELPAAPRGLLSALDEVLRRPWAVIGRADLGGSSSLSYLLGGALVCCVLYGAASGFFQGGSQVWVAALKAPLIVLASLLLCAPSFYVLSSLAGVEVSPRWLLATFAGLGAMLGLLLVALMPITWLFSVSSASLAFITVLQVCVWIVAVHFGFKFLAVAFENRGAQRPSMAWVLLFLVVSLQVSSQMRPVLWRAEGEDLFAPRKMFFLQHFYEVAAGEDGKPIGGAEKEE